MNNGRKFAGGACVALGFGLVVLLANGTLAPPGLDAAATPAGALLALLPVVLVALVLFLAGLWLLRGDRGDRR